MIELPAQDQADELPDAGPRSYFATICLLSALAFVFLYEMMLSMASYGLRPWDMDVELLTSLGGLSRRLVFVNGEWWRLLTSPFLHAGPAHIFFNGFAICIIGPRLEGLVGWVWFLAIFAISCVCGGLLSLLINSPTLISVGASGGIMGLFATAVVVSFRLESGSGFRTALRMDAVRVLIPTLVPALLIPVIGGAQDGVDVAAHLGGALGGLCLGLFLLSRHAELEGRPKTPRQEG